MENTSPTTDRNELSTTESPFRLPKPDYGDKHAVMKYADDITAALAKAQKDREAARKKADDLRDEMTAADAILDDIKKSKKVDKAAQAYVRAQHATTDNAKRARAKVD